MIVRFVQRFLPHLVAVIALGVLLTVSGLLWMERANRFPLPPPGAYAGIVSGVWSSSGEDTFSIYMERQSEEPKFMIAMVRPGWEPRVITFPPVDTKVSDSVLPISLSGPGGKIRLRGSRVSLHEFKGVVDDLVTGATGHWTMSLISGPGQLYAEQDKQEIARWLTLKEELIDTEYQIHKNEQRVPELRDEITKLSAFIEDKNRLRTLADEKYQLIREEVVKTQTAVRALEEQAQLLENKLQLAQRVTPMGRLVSLSRESLEREGRWIDSMYRVSAKSNSPELEEAVQQGEEILKVQREIQLERKRILDLRGKSRR